MENLRWILLGAGILFVVVVYFLGRQRRSARERQVYDESSELPEFSATDLDMVDEGVGEVRIIASMDYETPDEPITQSQPVEDDIEPSPVEGNKPERDSQPSDSDIIMLCILAASKEETLRGDQINSAVRANGMVFGEMNIFHRYDADNMPLYSLANMLEPGSFDPEKLYETETSGLTMFMQASMVSDPAEALDDMLRTAYQISEMLGGRLCNRKRERLTEKDTIQYRELVDNLTAIS